jgi:hypothetical protein
MVKTTQATASTGVAARIAGRYEAVGLAGRAVPDGERVAGVEEAAGHGQSHRAEPRKTILWTSA